MSVKVGTNEKIKRELASYYFEGDDCVEDEFQCPTYDDTKKIHVLLLEPEGLPAGGYIALIHEPTEVCFGYFEYKTLEDVEDAWDQWLKQHHVL